MTTGADHDYGAPRPPAHPDAGTTGGAPTASTMAGVGSAGAASFLVAPPSLTLPKGGGAIRGIDAKFATNPVTGTASFTVPITVSPGRGGFGPSLTLAYDSGSGNSAYGFGWSLDTPRVTRKINKGLPRFIDPITEAPDSDVFEVSGAEDLVPMLNSSGTAPELDMVTDPRFVIRRYRPRVDGLYARIERWTTADGTDTHWRSLSRDNILTIYGDDADSRIAAPDGRVFSWLISQTRDDRGNAIIYNYRRDDNIGVDILAAHQSSRGPLDDDRRTINRYLKRIRYGNRVPMLDAAGKRPTTVTGGAIANAKWMFELVVDYGDHNAATPTPNHDQPWPHRRDAYSTYAPGFEVRTTRLCRRFLMFHHFPGADDVGHNCLVSSTDLTHTIGDTGYALLTSVTHSGYRRDGAGYQSRSLPPVDYTYSAPVIDPAVHTLPSDDLQNLPVGADGNQYEFVDLHAEGIPGILTRTGARWWYRRNISPISARDVEFDPVEAVRTAPGAAATAQLLDLGGDGHLDLVDFDGPLPGAYSHDDAEGWNPMRPFRSRPTVPVGGPGARLVDLDGDGLADLMITADDAVSWYRSAGIDGFDTGGRVPLGIDEDAGPTRAFINDTETLHLADMSGDGLTDLVRIRNGEVCYWPNLGYGRFGPKVVMDKAPRFDDDTGFSPRRILLADIDGTGTTDILYLHPAGVRLWFNESGNTWSASTVLPGYPALDDHTHVTVTDLKGQGTACLLWSSPHGADAGRQMRYVDLMGGTKPHLLTASDNNLGAETHVTYTSSTEYYLRDKRAGTPWITRLAFPVHVVARVDTYDHIGRNRFTTRYAYHHGYYDGVEREFRGFGMVEQWDADQYAAFTATGELPAGDNTAAEAFVPPVHTKTWFDTGVWMGADHIAAYYAGTTGDTDPGGARPPGEYWYPDALNPVDAQKLLLTDPALPAGLTLDELREAARARKGAVLRQEVFADDAGPGATEDQRARAARPYTVTQHTYQVRLLQHTGPNRHAIFDTHPAETLTYHYERQPDDPRVQHAITLEVGHYGEVTKEVSIGYGRDTSPLETEFDRAAQATTLMTATDSTFTKPLTDPAARPGDHRTPLPAESRTMELTGFGNRGTGPNGRFQRSDFVSDIVQPDGTTVTAFLPTTELPYEQDAPAGGVRRSRVIEHLRVYYRPDDLGTAAGSALKLLPLRTMEPRALAGESYKLAFTAGLLAAVFVRDGADLLDGNPAAVLGGVGPDQGGYRSSTDLKAAGLFPADDPDGHWWIPSGRIFYSPARDDANAAAEFAYAAANFVLPQRFRTPFDTADAPTETIIGYDNTDTPDGWLRNNLVVTDVQSPSVVDGVAGNRVTAAERTAAGGLGSWHIDYRVLQPTLVSDPNRNRTHVVFDILGMLVGTAVMGKPAPAPVEGDNLSGFAPDLTQDQVDSLFDGGNPYPAAPALINDASTRIVYDLHRFRRTRAAHPYDPSAWLPAGDVTLARETHATDPLPPHGLRIQLAYSYSDGYGREIQKKSGAENGPVLVGGSDVDPRWVASGWTILNNKGQPVRQYEPFFTATAAFEYGNTVGISPVLFYDPPGRVVATVNPNNTYVKVLFDPWKQTTFDTVDTCGLVNSTNPTAQRGDPRIDPDIAGTVADYFTHLPSNATWQSWYTPRAAGLLGLREVDAAVRSAACSNTPTTVHFDTLGRPFRTDTVNRVVCPGHPDDGKPDDTLSNRVVLDIEGNERAVRDADQQDADPLGRIVMRYDYTMIGTRIHQHSMEAGQLWTLADITEKALRAWDSRGHIRATHYDRLRRPIGATVKGTSPPSDPRTLGATIQVERIDYGDTHSATVPDDFNPELSNLRGQVYQHWDSSGVITNAQLDPNGEPIAAYDFKGNLQRTTRQLAADYKGILDWAAHPQPTLEDEVFASRNWYDALNRPAQTLAPYSTQPEATHNVTQVRYNARGLLSAIDVWLDTASPDEFILDPAITPPAEGVGIDLIRYNAKGQRERVDYKNSSTTQYWYDPNTFRLTRLYTKRGTSFTEDADNPHAPPPRVAAPDYPPNGVTSGVQNLTYTYDAAGNITFIHDSAQQRIFFRNQVADPSNDYTYDALHRLIRSTGREHLGQTGGAVNPPAFPDPFATGLDPNDEQAMGTYTETYVYDAVGNHISIKHAGSQPAQAGWTQYHSYSEASQIEPAKFSNRLTHTRLDPDDGLNPRRYRFDSAGSVTYMPHLGAGVEQAPNMIWDYGGRLVSIDRGGGGRVWYVYDSAGERVRKVWEKSASNIDERVYVAGAEVFRAYSAALPAVPDLVRETLSVTDGHRRIAMVETRTIDRTNNDKAPQQLVRYQLSNHLDSATVELDGHGQLISYEEYSPYGNTTYQASAAIAKRYRFTGKERDDETGFSYHGARYFVPWLGRWISCDPAELADGLNLYRYVSNNPVRLVDNNGLAGGKPSAIPGLIGDHPVLGELWDQATKKVLAPKFGAGTAAELRDRFTAHVDDVIKAKGWGSNRAAGTGINVGRETYSRVRAEFGRLAEEAGISLKGLQAHHAIDPVAKNPGQALNPHNLSMVTGNAATKGTVHNAAHAGWDAVIQRMKNWMSTSSEAAAAAARDEGRIAAAVKTTGQSAVASGGLTKAARILGPVGAAAGVYFLGEKAASAASAPPPPSTKSRTERAVDTAARAVDIGSDALALVPGPTGMIAGGARAQTEIAIFGIQHTGGDDRIIKAGTEAEHLAKKVGATDGQAHIAGATVAGLTAVAEGTQVIGLVAMGPIGWGVLGLKAYYKK